MVYGWSNLGQVNTIMIDTDGVISDRSRQLWAISIRTILARIKERFDVDLEDGGIPFLRYVELNYF